MSQIVVILFSRVNLCVFSPEDVFWCLQHLYHPLCSKELEQHKGHSSIHQSHFRQFDFVAVLTLLVESYRLTLCGPEFHFDLSKWSGKVHMYNFPPLRFLLFLHLPLLWFLHPQLSKTHFWIGKFHLLCSTFWSLCWEISQLTGSYSMSPTNGVLRMSKVADECLISPPIQLAQSMVEMASDFWSFLCDFLLLALKIQLLSFWTLKFVLLTHPQIRWFTKGTINIHKSEQKDIILRTTSERLGWNLHCALQAVWVLEKGIRPFLLNNYTVRLKQYSWRNTPKICRNS